jgi:peptidoglycan/xylan/chitin deacetylase (PgdA/CDA1 family)
MQLKKRIKHIFQPRALVLMYHRIAELATDPWQLAVSPSNFEQQLQVLHTTGQVIALTELIQRLRRKAVPAGSICLTFDDGYRDNYSIARPLLEKYACAATYFIPTHYTGQQDRFWWDELEHIFLCQRRLPSLLALQTGFDKFEFDLGTQNILTDADLEQHKHWAWPAPPPTRRCALYLDIWNLLRPLPYDNLQLVLGEIKAWAGFETQKDADGYPMSLDQLSELKNHKLLDVGLHTSTHPALGYHSREVQHAEIFENRIRLQNILGRTADSIAYPYGNYNDITLEVARDLQLTAGFTTTEKIVSNYTDPLQVGRFQVRNWNGNTFAAWIDKWKKSSQFL